MPLGKAPVFSPSLLFVPFAGDSSCWDGDGGLTPATVLQLDFYSVPVATVMPWVLFMVAFCNVLSCRSCVFLKVFILLNPSLNFSPATS